MKKSTYRLCLKFLLLIMTFPAAANYGDHPDPNSAAIEQNTGNIATYLANLGAFLGYDITKQNTEKPSSQTTLLTEDTEQALQNSVFNSLLGAIPVNAFSTYLSNFVPADIEDKGLALLNAFANNVFPKSAYQTAQTAQSPGVSANALIDQQNFQADPVSQSVLNILGTPNFSFCMNADESALITDCPTPLTQNIVTSNVIGPLPETNEFLSYNYNKQFLSQLNSNVLVAPLMYATDPGDNPAPTTGLPAATQAQQAANFIRYATASVIPPTLPRPTSYSNVLTTAKSSTQSVAVRLQAQTNLTNYLAKLRVYAAQMSVGVGNLYYIFQRRMPQSVGTSSTSQALNEFKMATWRLFDPSNTKENSQWINQINSASTATVQKEIVTLLAEINYQLYLTRQQQERMLLTESLVLLQNVHGSEPDSSFSPNTPNSSGPSTSTSGS